MSAILSIAMGMLVKKVKAAGSGDPGHARGWGDNINWMTLTEGQRQADQMKTPMMVVVHKMTCPACMHFKRLFSRSSEVQELSRQFVMVNLTMGEVPQSRDYFPDGHYVPRIMFFTPNGRLMTRHKYTEGDYQYNFPNIWELVRTMERVISD